MSASVTLYRPTGSVVDRLDPRAKIASASALLMAVVIADSLWLKAGVVMALLATWFAARLPTRLLALTVMPLAFFFATTMTLRGVIRGAGAANLTEIGPIAVSRSGALDGLQMCLQILSVVLILTVAVRTTAPVLLSDGLESMLGWTKRFKVPVHDAVMMFSIALRFLPLMTQEFTRLQTAQLARGGGLHRGRLWTRAHGVVPLLLPLVIVSIGRATELSEAMDSRGYRGDVNRTPVREFQLRSTDVAVVVVSVAVLAMALYSVLLSTSR